MVKKFLLIYFSQVCGEFGEGGFDGGWWLFWVVWMTKVRQRKCIQERKRSKIRKESVEGEEITLRKRRKLAYDES